MSSSWPSPLMGGTDPWDGGDADPICSPPQAVALQEEEKEQDLETQQANPCVLQAAAPSDGL